MLHDYIDSAMQQAECEFLRDDRLYFCHIPTLRGAWAAAETEALSRVELAEVLEDWIELGLGTGDHIPVLAGIDLNGTQ